MTTSVAEQGHSAFDSDISPIIVLALEFAQRAVEAGQITQDAVPTLALERLAVDEAGAEE